MIRRLSHALLLRRRAAVLVIVLWIALGLTAMALTFGHAMMLEYRGAANAEAGLQSERTLDAARLYITYVLENLETPGTMPLLDEDYEAERVWVGDGVFWLIGRGDSADTKDEPVFGLVDEASKLNINTATAEMLEMLPYMTPEMAGAIIDWRDENTEQSPEGAETQAYSNLNPSYICKDAPFETVEEIRLLVGMNLDRLLGEDTNRNGALDYWENDSDENLPKDNRDGQLDPGFLEYLTVYSYEPAKGADGEARINVNDEEKVQDLTELLNAELGEERASEIMSALGIGQNQGGGGRDSGNQQTQTQDEDQFKSILQFALKGNISADELALVAASITTSDDDQPGLINVNTASKAVLACVPGIGTEYAQQIVSHRQGLDDDELVSEAWLLDIFDEDIAEELAEQAGPYLTGRAWQYTVDAAAVDAYGRGFRRAQYIIDTAGGKPTVLFRRDLSRLGWPLGETIREELSSLDEDEGRLE